VDVSSPESTWRFDRRELAGSMGDLGTLLPLTIGMILVCGLDATAILVCVGLFYVVSGVVFRTTMPVQPMKVIGAYAIARGLGPLEVTTAGLWMGVMLIVLASLGAVDALRRHVGRSVIRGVQLSTGVLLLTEGVRFIVGRSQLQGVHDAAEPFLAVQTLGPIPVGVVLGVVAVVLILLLLDNRKAPAALVVVALGSAVGLALGGYRGFGEFEIGLHLPGWLPFGLPDGSTMVVALVALALPQLPMTLGNAVVAQADLTRQYFGDEVARRCNVRALALSMGLANLVCAALGGMPLCHGAGGLAAHHRFGARTAGSNLMIGGAFLVVGLLVGDQATAVLTTLPFAVMGALLAFAGAQLALTLLDLDRREDLLVAIAVLGVTLATNLAVGFVVGLVLERIGRWRKLAA
jgi:sulfate permease, SulP family